MAMRDKPACFLLKVLYDLFISCGTHVDIDCRKHQLHAVKRRKFFNEMCVWMTSELLGKNNATLIFLKLRK